MLRLKIANIIGSPQTPVSGDASAQPDATALAIDIHERAASPAHPSPRPCTPVTASLALQTPARPKRSVNATTRNRSAPLAADPRARNRQNRAGSTTSSARKISESNNRGAIPLWFTTSRASLSVWEIARAACGHTPEDDAWALKTLAAEGLGAEALDQIHAMMSHLSSPTDAKANIDLFRILVTYPPSIRSRLAFALLQTCASAAAESSIIRVGLAKKRSGFSCARTIDALQRMHDFADVTHPQTFLRIFALIRGASEPRRRAILPAVSYYCQTAIDPTGESAMHILRHCLRMQTADEALAFCHFVTRCHGARLDFPGPFCKTTLQSAALVSDDERVAFASAVALLHPTSNKQEAMGSCHEVFVSPLAAIDPALRVAATAAVVLVYADTSDISRCIRMRRDALIFLSHASAWSFIDALRSDTRSAEDTEVLYRGLCQALIAVKPGFRHTALEITQTLVATTDYNSAIIDHLLVLGNVARFLRTYDSVRTVDLQDAAHRTQWLVQPYRDIEETTTIFFALAESTPQERDAVCDLVRLVAPAETRVSRRDVLVRKVLNLDTAQREQLLALMAPYAFGPGHDQQTTYMIFVSLVYAQQHGLLEDMETRMRTWTSDSGLADVPACAGVMVYYGLRDMLRQHQSLSSGPPSSTQLSWSNRAESVVTTARHIDAGPFLETWDAQSQASYPDIDVQGTPLKLSPTMGMEQDPHFG